LDENITGFETHCQKNKLTNFLQWFQDQYLHQDWLPTWVDVDRPEREGFSNTNDFTEALLKQLVPIGTTTSVANLVTVLVQTVFPYYEDMVIQEETKEVHVSELN